MANIDYTVMHRLPERIRVRIPAIRHHEHMTARVRSLLRKEKGVREVIANADSCSVTIHFDSALFDPQLWFEHLRLSDLKRGRNKSASGKKRLPWPLSDMRRATFALGELVPARAQFLLGAASLIATIVELPAAITSCMLTLALMPIANRALQTLLDEGRLGAEALDGASCAMLIRQSNYFPAALMTFLIGTGELIRSLAYERCAELIDHQLALSQHSAWLMKGTRRIRVPVATLKPGDQIVVYPGELIAGAGPVVQGEGTIMPASPESEFVPTLVRAGDWVNQDMVLMDGKLYYRNETCQLPEASDPYTAKSKRRWVQRTQFQKLALKRAYGTVGPILALAGLLFAASRDLQRAMALICFDFITGLRIALPTAILSSMYQAGVQGIVVRNAATLEKLAEVDVLIFARSGTLTTSKPAVTEIFTCEGFALEDVTRLAAAVEQRYSELAAYAIYSYAKTKSIPVPERTSSRVFGGLGVSGEVEGHNVMVGSTRLMQIGEIDLGTAQQFLDKCEDRGDARACVAIDGKLAGVIAYQDPVRPDAPAVVAGLKKMGISEIVMSTGGTKSAAEDFAAKLGIHKVHSRILPEDQAALVRSYKDRGHCVAVVGYDADDTLALEHADIAITLGTGADVARYRADVVLTSDDLDGLIEGIEIARSGMSLARQNLFVVSIPNLLGLALSLIDRTDVLKATILNNGSVLVGAANGLRPLFGFEQHGTHESSQPVAGTEDSARRLGRADFSKTY